MNEVNEKRKKEFSMLWWNFNKYVRFPLGIFLSLGNISYYSELEFNTTIWLLFGIDVTYIVLLCTTFYHFVERNKIGYTLLNILLIVELLTNAFTTTMKSGSFVTTNFIINLCVLGLIWTLPNFIYFRKRRSLFCNNDTDNREEEYNNYEEEKKNNETLDILIKNFEQPQNIGIADKDKIEQEDTESKAQIIAIKEDKETEKVQSVVSENMFRETDGIEHTNSTIKFSNIIWKVSTIIFAIIAIIMTILFIKTCNDVELLEEEMVYLNSNIDSLEITQKKYFECISEKYELERKANFFDKYIVIMPANTKVYHKYDCTYCDKSSFYIFDEDEAKRNGYVPCSHCIE